MNKLSRENAMLCDVQYVKANKKAKEPDFLYLIWKDLDTGEKHLNIIPEPKMDIYFEKPEYRNHSYNLNYQDLDKVDRYTCKYSNIPFEIAKNAGDSGKQFLQNIMETRNFSELRRINLYPYVFGHDYDIRTYYRHKFNESFGNDREKHITKGFLDIETDSIEVKGFPNAKADCPVDLVTVIDGDKKDVYTFALVGREYKEKDLSFLTGNELKRKQSEENRKRGLYEHRLKEEKELMDDLDGLNEELHELFDESYGEMNYHQYFYTDEAKLLVHLFQLINTLKMDFIFIWNISFDIPYILDRLEYLGYDPKEIICNKEFPSKQCYFKKDTRNFDVKNKSDFFHVSSFTTYYDQMILYAANRKSKGELRSTKLNYIAKREIKDEKLDYSEDGSIKTLAYRNYRKYFIYNIKDVLLQYGIEDKVHDAETLYIKSTQNLTSYDSVFKQSIVLRNVQYKSFNQMGLIPGGNCNGILNYKPKDAEKEDDDDDTYEGALVGNTKLITKFGQKMHGKRTNYIFRYSIDMDMSAFYPSTKYVLNIDASKLIFKVIIEASQFDVRGGDIPYHGITDTQIVKTNDDSFVDDIAKEVIDNFQTGNYLSTGYKFMNLPSMSEMEELLKEVM